MRSGIIHYGIIHHGIINYGIIHYSITHYSITHYGLVSLELDGRASSSYFPLWSLNSASLNSSSPSSSEGRLGRPNSSTLPASM